MGDGLRPGRAIFPAGSKLGTILTSGRSRSGARRQMVRKLCAWPSKVTWSTNRSGKAPTFWCGGECRNRLSGRGSWRFALVVRGVVARSPWV